MSVMSGLKVLILNLKNPSEIEEKKERQASQNAFTFTELDTVALHERFNTKLVTKKLYWYKSSIHKKNGNCFLYSTR